MRIVNMKYQEGDTFPNFYAGKHPNAATIGYGYIIRIYLFDYWIGLIF